MNGSRRGVLAPLVLSLGLAACGGSGSNQTGSSGNAFTFLAVDSVTPSCATSALNASSSTVVTVTLSNNLKNPTLTTPTALDNVQIESYTVRLTRTDGGPSTGPFSQGTSITIPAGTVPSGGGALSGNQRGVPVIIVPADLKREVGGPGSGAASIVLNGQNFRGQRLSVNASVVVNFVATDSGDSNGSAGGCYGASLFRPVRPLYAMLSLAVLLGSIVGPLTRPKKR
jgi:hypothetical protein